MRNDLKGFDQELKELHEEYTTKSHPKKKAVQIFKKIHKKNVQQEIKEQKQKRKVNLKEIKEFINSPNKLFNLSLAASN